MPYKPSNLGQFWHELKRRKVVRVITVYAAAAWVILEFISNIEEPFGLPDWTTRFVFVILCVGLIISIILSWIYDITPEGIEKTKPAQKATEVIPEKLSTVNAWKIATFISIIIIIGLIIFHLLGVRKQAEIITDLEKTIAVLPFVDMSPQKDQEYFCDGIADEITNALVHVEGLNVIARTSAFSFKGKQEDIRDIGKKLGAGTLLEGSIMKEGNKIRITAQLVKVENGSHLWSEQYDRDITSIFDIQDEISLAIVDNLKVKLLGEEKAAVVKRHTENLEAYDFYLRGNEYYQKSYEERDFNIAIQMYQKAIDLDPDFALAYARLGMSHLFFIWFNYDRSEDRLMKSKQAIDTALKIDRKLAEAHIALGVYYYFGLRDYSNALQQLEIALNQSPKNSECIFWMAAVHRRAGNWEKAKEYFMKACELDPRSSRTAQNTAQTFGSLREFPEALTYSDIAISLRPDYYAAYLNKAWILVNWNGNTKKAWNLMREASEIGPSVVEYPDIKHEMMLLELYDGNYEKALKYLPLAKSDAHQGSVAYRPWYQYYAQIYGLMGNPELEYAYYDSSRLMLENKLIEAPDDSRLYSSLGIAYAGLGLTEKAKAAGEKSVALMPISKDAYLGTWRVEELARIYVMVGDYEKALEQIELLLSIPSGLTINLLKLDPVWKPLWDHPEFNKLIEKYAEN